MTSILGHWQSINPFCYDYYDNTSDFLNLGFNFDDYDNTSDFHNLSDFGGWCEADEQAFTIRMFQTCVFCVIFILGVMGNGLVIATFSLYRRFRLRSMTDVFLLHLALADLLLLLTLPLQATDTHLGWIFPSLLCKATRACYAINTYSGLLLLACISVDRYMVVARAQEMLRLRTQILTGGKIAAVCVWFVAVLLSLPEILFSGVSVSGIDNDTHCVMKISGGVKMATNGAIISIFCLSLIVMVTCYSLIAKVLWEGRGFRRGTLHRQRTLKLMVALVFVFLVFQLPYTVVLLHKMTGPFCGLLLEYVTCTLAYMRCCLNPILYALVGVRFRNDVLKLIHDAGCPCGPQLAPGTTSSTSISPSPPGLTVVSPCSPTSSDRHFTNFKF
uniref:Chemokine (C-C motif) receptor 10 n=1 Tax=Sphaeramia orbicularis TaxID=375764 RepID=A0A672ZRI3_9TELE